MDNLWIKYGLTLMIWIIIKNIPSLDFLFIDNLIFCIGATLFIMANNKKDKHE